jgi:two-component system, NarL family, response regulator DegU
MKVRLHGYLFLRVPPTLVHKDYLMNTKSGELKFLIVDDNAMMRETLRRFIVQKEDEVVECDDGRDALALYQQHRPDWVLMDINMKHVGGIEATGNIVAADPHARVIIVTDYGDRFFRRAADEAGARYFITKEDLADLPSIIRRDV